MSKHHQGRSIRVATTVYKCGTCTKQGTWLCEYVRGRSGQMHDREGRGELVMKLAKITVRMCA